MTLIYHPAQGEPQPVTLTVDRYANNGHLAVTMTGPDGQAVAPVTVNLPHMPAGDTLAALDTNNTPGIETFITDNRLGEPTGMTVTSGWCTYPVYQLDPDTIRNA